MDSTPRHDWRFDEKSAQAAFEKLERKYDELEKRLRDNRKDGKKDAD